MKISNSKKQLARIISENGGWRDGSNWSAQDKKSFGVGPSVWFYGVKPERHDSAERWSGTSVGQVIDDVNLVANWHQTILSRDEYFHLYPAPDAVMAKAEEPEHVWTNPPTIESLAADYRSKLAIAKQAQEEADSHRCGAEAALEKLVAAGKAVGLVLSVVAPEPEKPANPYTGKFYNDDIGSDVSYADERLFDQICDGCGKRLGKHIGRRCPNA